MRLVLNTVVALILVAVLGGVVYKDRVARDREAMEVQTQQEVRRFQQQVHLQAALEFSDSGVRGYPEMVKPAWFGGRLPRNALLKPGHPWLEIANEKEAALRHPRRCTAETDQMAAFWYNPANGIVRARVPAEITDEKALHLYNFINRSDLTSILAPGQPARADH